jgi:hypothetical protein
MKCAAVTKPSRRGCWPASDLLSVLEDETALPHGEIENRANEPPRPQCARSSGRSKDWLKFKKTSRAGGAGAVAVIG